ncbi:MAG: hypothetical protein RR543_05435 [Erysipelotrichales bacterium]
MNNEIQKEFARLYYYQSALTKFFNNVLSSEYNVSELHYLELMSIEENINGKELSLQLKLTKGATILL